MEYMLSILWNFIIGYIRIGIANDDKATRFLYLCKTNNIEIWKIKQTEDVVSFNISQKNIKKIKKIILKTGTDIEITSTLGIPNIIKKYKKRIGFLIGFFVCILLIYISSLYLWHIEIIGQEIYTDQEIVDFINETQPIYGIKKEKYDCKALEVALREKYSKMSWINCSIKGTNLIINFSENPYQINEMSNEICDIEADKDCIIDKIIVKNGTALCSQGDKIKKGQILVTGKVDLLNEYGEQTETMYVSSDAVIYGLVTYTYDDSIEMNYYEKEYYKEKKYLSFGFGPYLYTPIKIKSEKNTELISTTKNLKITSSFYLPIYITKTTVKYYNPQKKTYTENEIKKIAKKRLQKYIDDLTKKGMKIRKNSVTISIVDKKCIVYGDIEVQEQVGLPVRLELDEHKE